MTIYKIDHVIDMLCDYYGCDEWSPPVVQLKEIDKELKEQIRKKDEILNEAKKHLENHFKHECTSCIIGADCFDCELKKFMDKIK